MIYQFGHVEYYMDLQHRKILTGNIKVFKEFNADDDAAARDQVGSLFDGGLAQEHPLPDVDTWEWRYWQKEGAR